MDKISITSIIVLVFLGILIVCNVVIKYDRNNLLQSNRLSTNISHLKVEKYERKDLDLLKRIECLNYTAIQIHVKDGKANYVPMYSKDYKEYKQLFKYEITKSNPIPTECFAEPQMIEDDKPTSLLFCELIKNTFKIFAIVDNNSDKHNCKISFSVIDNIPPKLDCYREIITDPEYYYRLSDIRIENRTYKNTYYIDITYNLPTIYFESIFPTQKKFKILDSYFISLQNNSGNSTFIDTHCDNILYVFYKYIFLSDNLLRLTLNDFETKNCSKMIKCIPILSEMNNDVLKYFKLKHNLTSTQYRYNYLINKIDDLNRKIMKCFWANCTDLNMYNYTESIYTESNYTESIYNETNIDKKIKIVEDLIQNKTQNKIDVNPLHIYEVKEYMKIFNERKMRKGSLLNAFIKLVYFRLEEGIEFLNYYPEYKNLTIKLYNSRNSLNICINE